MGKIDILKIPAYRRVQCMTKVLFPGPVKPESRSQMKIRKMEKCGICKWYFCNKNTALVELTSSIKKEDKLVFETTNGLFEQEVPFVRVRRSNISVGKLGKTVSIPVGEEPLIGGVVYKVIIDSATLSPSMAEETIPPACPPPSPAG